MEYFGAKFIGGISVVGIIGIILIIPITLIKQTYNYYHLLSPKRWSQNVRGDKFSGSSLAVGKTDAFALLLK
jgi:hypothetical protein